MMDSVLGASRDRRTVGRAPLGMFRAKARRRPMTRGPHVHALKALMLLQSSRLAAREDSRGALIPLPRQDRSLWDRDRIAAGLAALAAAGEGERASEYHLLAGIAACHAAAESFAATDWARIAWLYDDLASRGSNFVIEVNRAIAVSHVEGPGAGLALLAGIDDARSEDYYLLVAARADMLGEAGRARAAATGFEEAAAHAPTEAERRYFLHRVAEHRSESGAAGMERADGL